MFNTMVHLTMGQLVLLLLVAMVAPFVLAAALQHFFGVANAHAHINVGIGTFLVVGLAAMALVNTDVVPAFAHAFDNVHAVHTVASSDRQVASVSPLAKPTHRPSAHVASTYNWRRK